MTSLITNQNIGTPLHHLTGSSAVLIAIVKPVSFEIVVEDGLAAFDRLPCVRTAAVRVNTLVSDTKSRLAIHEDIRRSGRRRTNAGVRATSSVMRVRRNARLIAESRLGAHYEKTITQSLAFDDTQ
jgi:hypothetical protein